MRDDDLTGGIGRRPFRSLRLTVPFSWTFSRVGPDRLEPWLRDTH